MRTDGAAERGDNRAGGESLPDDTCSLLHGSATTAIDGGKASKGRKAIAGIRERRPEMAESLGETTMNPRVVSRCNSADRIDEEKIGEVA